jgi:hypothetical protein
MAYLREHPCALLLAALCLIILLAPILPATAMASALLNLGLMAVLVVAVWALGVRRLALAGIGLLALLTFSGILAQQVAGFRWLQPLAFALAAVFTAGVTAALMRYVLNFQRITPDKVYGAVASYILVAFTFATLFGFVEQVQPGAFRGAALHASGQSAWEDLMYFSFTVLTSTGFGEITPATGFARALTVIEQVVGVMYVAFLIARMANLYDRPQR